ncbi:MAG TPA: DUF952 domain-containing protein [Anaerolineales bacterium]|nr:DUF952 domain-containing protein [Anaerolineales bacterium]
MKIFHITAQSAWQDAQARGQYTAPSLESEGFIHSSTLSQILPVAEKFYKGQSGLVLLVIDPSRLTSDLKWEPPFDGAPPPGVPVGDPFPHVYGPINVDAVIEALAFEPDASGRFSLPDSLKTDQ